MAGIITPNVIGPILDNVNLNPPSFDCLTGLDITPTDYRVPFAIADTAFLGWHWVYILDFVCSDWSSISHGGTDEQMN